MTRVIRAFAAAAMTAAGLALVVMMGVTILDIVGRSGFNLPIHGVYEIVQLCLVVAVYGGLAEASLRAAHVNVDLIDHLVSLRTRQVIILIANLAAFVFLAFLMAGSIAQIGTVGRFGDFTPDLQISLLWLWGPILGGLVVAGCAALLGMFTPAETDAS